MPWSTQARPTAKALLRYLHRLTATSRTNAERETDLTPATIHRIEEDVIGDLGQQGLPPDRLLMDTTNFFTCPPRGGLPRKDHSKEPRYDRSLIGLGLVTAGPATVLSELFPGNLTDPEVFDWVFEAHHQRLDRLEVPSEDPLIVFDRGANSTGNFDDVVGTVRVIAAVNCQVARVLCRVPLDEFHEVAQDGVGMGIPCYPATLHG